MEQIHRTERYLKKIRGIYEGCEHKYDDSKFYEDDVISFFIHCHHISDWIIKLNRVGETKTEINRYINKHKELVICADFCNGQKHCYLERVWGEAQPHMSGKQWSITSYTDESGIPVTFKAKYSVVAGDEVYDALEIAEKCITLWKNYIRRLALRAI